MRIYSGHHVTIVVGFSTWPFRVVESHLRRPEEPLDKLGVAKNCPSLWLCSSGKQRVRE
jgi:hypothetical protein